MAIRHTDTIEVLALFRGGLIEPKRFRYGTRVYDIQSVDLRFEERRGRELVRFFSVFDGVNSFRLAFFSESGVWRLEEESRL